MTWAPPSQTAPQEGGPGLPDTDENNFVLQKTTQRNGVISAASRQSTAAIVDFPQPCAQHAVDIGLAGRVAAHESLECCGLVGREVIHVHCGLCRPHRKDRVDDASNAACSSVSETAQ